MKEREGSGIVGVGQAQTQPYSPPACSNPHTPRGFHFSWAFVLGKGPRLESSPSSLLHLLETSCKEACGYLCLLLTAPLFQAQAPQPRGACAQFRR